MFQSEPICILTAGPTTDGRDISQTVIDDIAETYDPKRYTARINDNHDHSEWSWKGGSVLSVEKRGNELWAIIKPNSHLLRNIESGQFLHTSCEYLDDFAQSGKAYLTGLAFTDTPASLGTTQVHLSAQDSKIDKRLVSSGHMLSAQNYSNITDETESPGWLIRQLSKLLNIEPNATKEQLSTQEESEQMSAKTEELLEQSVEQNKELNGKLGQLIEHLSSTHKPLEPEQPETPAPQANEEVQALKGQVEQLSTQMTELTTTLSKITDEDARKLAGQDGEEERYL